MDKRAESIETLTKFMQLTPKERMKLLGKFDFTADFMNKIVQGFIDCNNKYADLLVLSAGMYYTIEKCNTQLRDSITLMNDVSTPVKEYTETLHTQSGTMDTQESEETLSGLINLFEGITSVLDKLSEGTQILVKLNSIAIDNYFQDPSNKEDRIYATDARAALAFFIADNNSVVDDADIDEDALNKALQDWGQKFKGE